MGKPAWLSKPLKITPIPLHQPIQALKEIKQEEKAFNKIRQLLPEYEGAKLEDLVKRIFIEMNPFNLEFTAVGRYWDRKGENEIDLILLDEDSRSAFVVEVKRNLSKALKKDQKIKLYAKVASLKQLNGYHVRYFFAGIDNKDIVITGEENEKFIL